MSAGRKVETCAVCGNTRWQHPDQSVFVPDVPSADRIAQLTAELAEAWRVAEIWRNDERAAHERTKAEMADARADIARVMSEAHGIHDRLIGERDAAQAKLASVEAVAAAMREWIEGDNRHGCGECGLAPGRHAEHCRIPGLLDGTAGRALAARVPLLEQKARFNDIRQRAALALFDRGFIEAPHEDGCPQDDTCDCPLMPLAQAVVNGDERLQKVDAAAAEKALAALDEEGGTDGQ